jgi:sn-glycerol 3-phosphate transport system substrate-binding protein
VIVSANFVREYVINKEAIALDPLVEKDGTTPERVMPAFWPALRPNAMDGGKVYGVAFHNSTPLLYSSVDAFKLAGLDPDRPPQTCWNGSMRCASPRVRPVRSSSSTTSCTSST